MSFLIIVIIRFEGTNQSSFCAKTTENLEMIVDKRGAWVTRKLLINLIVTREPEVDWTPQIV